jgi:succinyl-CoA synthetase beta subunit
MKIHEYQAKEILSRFGVTVPRGRAVTTSDEARKVADELREETGGKVVVVKAQIHAGGRGKGRFKEHPDLGGVKVCTSADEAEQVAEKMLGSVLVTRQTGPEGRRVETVLVEQGLDIENELYAGMVVDRGREKTVLMASTEGGMEIEEVAAAHPEKIITEPAHPLVGFQPYQGRKVAWRLGLSAVTLRDCGALLAKCAQAFEKLDASLLEINPLIVTAQGKVVALDAKINLDDNASFRHKGREELRDHKEEDPAEQEGRKWGLSYVSMEGNIGCMVNGAGLAMATMDIIKHHGGSPANFLDVGGGARADQVAAAFKIITRDPKVKAIFVNIFGGIMRCDVIAEGVCKAVEEVGLSVPLVVRLEGTNVDEGKRILAESGLDIVTASEMADGAKKAVEAAGRAG